MLLNTQLLLLLLLSVICLQTRIPE